ncbi:NfeD family protein [Thalassotalea fusca]
MSLWRKAIAIIVLLVSHTISAQTDDALSMNSATYSVPVLSIDGAIGPAVSEYLVSEIEKAQISPYVPLIIITIDTPGGLSSSLRQINQVILSSSKPIACLVHPQGARAASAGTYILYACHFAAMAPATTLGAATPVNMASPTAPSQQEKPPSASAMEKKVLNDAIAYMRSLAQLRNRNEEWAELAVSEAATLTAQEAFEKNVINYLADNPSQLLNTIIQSGELSSSDKVITVSNTRLNNILPDWRNQFISTITDPNIAYILLMIGIYGLILEFYSPGIGVAGITGAISLLIALYALQLLPLNYSGIALLLLGIALLVVESLMPSFGIWGIGGIIAFVLGSIFLIDTEQPEFVVSLPLIAAFAFVSFAFIVFSLGLIWRKRKAKVVSGPEELIGALAIAEGNYVDSGFVLFNGERWAATFSQPVNKGQYVKINAIEGLVLTTSPIVTEESSNGTTT